MKVIFLTLLLSIVGCSGKQTYLDPRLVGQCVMEQGYSAKFYKVAGLDGRGYLLRELVVAGNRNVGVVELSYLKIVNEPLDIVLDCEIAEADVMAIWGGE